MIACAVQAAQPIAFSLSPTSIIFIICVCVFANVDCFELMIYVSAVISARRRQTQADAAGCQRQHDSRWRRQTQLESL